MKRGISTSNSTPSRLQAAFGLPHEIARESRRFWLTLTPAGPRMMLAETAFFGWNGVFIPRPHPFLIAVAEFRGGSASTPRQPLTPRRGWRRFFGTFGRRTVSR